MIAVRRLFVLLIWTTTSFLLAASPTEPEDVSQAGTDGPHVFYRGDKILVKYVVMRDTGAKAVTQTYTDKQSISLTCSVPESGDKFTFPLRESLPIPTTRYAASSKILALSDIEGNFKALKTMLLGAGVIDQQFNWTYGDGRLVLLGDFFDRGLNVTECLWLLYKLDGEATAAGGSVHFILGNHEIINLQGNTLYVRRKYLENAQRLGIPYNQWFDNNSELGRWLRSKNSVEKIGDYIFCHGGVSMNMVRTGLSLEDINRIAREYLGKPDHAITDSNARAIFDIRTGIFWYRGLAKNQATVEEIKEIIQYTGGKRIVVGHTMQSDLTANYNGKVLCIDLYHEEHVRQGFMKTLLIENGFCYALDSRGGRSSVFSITFPRKQEDD